MAEEEAKRGSGTLAVHAGTDGAQPHGTVALGIFRTSTYTFRDTAELCAHMTGERPRMEYGRYGNPTQAAAEAKLAALDGAQHALLFGSGMAAVTTTLLAMLRQGQHIVLTDDCYRRTRQFCVQILSRLGIEHSIVPTTAEAVAAALRPETRVVLTESPTNPYLRVADLPAIASVLRGHPAKLVVDSTFATPINQRPLSQGADLVIHSATKYLGGHNDILAGVVSGGPIVEAIRDLQAILGGIVDPETAWLLVRGLKTLPLRIAAQNATAQRLAERLEADPRVARVYYPGLPTHGTHEVARRLMSGYGGVISMELRADLAGTSRFIDATRIPQIAPSLGGPETLIEQVALMSYFELTTEEREALGIRDSLVRLAVGLEDAEDLERDLVAALDAIGPAHR
ncbi:MAG: aminotransferase class I/II-fold pyridoxal phosphate-dependent enzyme [Deltaproteobacteria bacterium]|nr:aminotransferase class I/II-fold pyridoxal phosphate-dependent enzyme [Deltaproteobacteria bacterium]MCB9786288.1 aminotransferase class I/II-fold pyridoxal phosphate-dependent enzyme [Deltaproteobacteria bacterium]